MKVMMASDCGHPGRPNEDFVGAVPNAVVLLDGAGIPGTDVICHHGVAWYSHTLGTTLLRRLSREPGTDLVAVLADSIVQVSDLHRHACDIADPSSPQSTVAILRCHAGRADYLVLADIFVVLDSAEAVPRVVTDPREVDARNECLAELSGLSLGTPEYARVIDTFRARRNQPGGYWIAKDDPRAATQAVTGSVPLEQLTSAAVLSNGASRIVDPYRLADWPVVLDLMRTKGPHEIVRRVRKAESQAADSAPDDATVVYWEPVNVAA